MKCYKLDSNQMEFINISKNTKPHKLIPVTKSSFNKLTRCDSEKCFIRLLIPMVISDLCKYYNSEYIAYILNKHKEHNYSINNNNLIMHNNIILIIFNYANDIYHMIPMCLLHQFDIEIHELIQEFYINNCILLNCLNNIGCKQNEIIMNCTALIKLLLQKSYFILIYFFEYFNVFCISLFIFLGCYNLNCKNFLSKNLSNFKGI